MPPSPALRCSPGWESRIQNIHKRGRSFESGLPLKAKDDDLALFNDMQSKEKDNFLLHTTDDLDDSIAKLRYYSDFKLGINIPTRGESSDLLNVDGEKNDYDWLLTPPDTPLFPSLDDEEPQPVNLARRGRQRSQPISIRSSVTEKTQRTSRSSSSPHRSSPSPRSSIGITQPRGTLSSAPHSSPTAILRSTTPSRRPSTPPTKPSTPTPRSSTPTLPRVNSVSNGQPSSSGRRGTSPLRTNRGNSSSPKLRGWQTNLPGFSCDPPPNLRTSLADRPSSYTRGLSPASRNGRQSMSPTSSRNTRQSMSPTASRSVSSWHSHERDRLSSYSKGSAASSGDDDVDSLQSLSVGSFCRPTGGKNGMLATNRAMAFSKKANRTPSSSSAPKRSFDSALRQMEHRKTPQNMFRPLLSSVPTTTFYVGKTSSLNHPMFSRNSSLTTSSNASSEQGACVVPDMESNDHDHNNLAGEWEQPQGNESQEEIFAFDKTDDMPERGKGTGFMTHKIDLEELQKASANMVTTSQFSYATGNPSEVNQYGKLATCSRCGNQFRIMDVDPTADVCEECAENEVLFNKVAPLTALCVPQNEKLQSNMADGMDCLANEMQFAMDISELPEKSSIDVPLGLHEMSVVSSSLPNGSQLCLDLMEKQHSEKQTNSYQAVKSTQTENQFQPLQEVSLPVPRVENLEGTGISVLLQSSSNSKWPVVQGRPFSATNILLSEPSYSRDYANSTKRSTSRGSASASSSIDLESSRQSDGRLQRQVSSVKSEREKKTSDCTAKFQSPIVSQSTVPSNANEAVDCPNSGAEQLFLTSLDAVEIEALGRGGSSNDKHGNPLEIMVSGSMNSLAITQAVDSVDACSSSVVCGMESDPTESQLSSQSESMYIPDTSATSSIDHGDSTLCVHLERLVSIERIGQDTDAQLNMLDTSVNEEDNCTLNASVCGNNIPDAATNSSSSTNIGPKEHQSAPDVQSESHSLHDPDKLIAAHEWSVSTISEKDMSESALESRNIDHTCEKPIITVEGPMGCMPRSLTFEEATDTILFCSSIIHDLAYKAATVAVEKEEPVFVEALRPTVTILGNSISNQNNSWTSSYKRTPKAQKPKRKRMETETKTMPMDLGDNLKIQTAMPSNHPEVPSKSDSAKPPKLESKCNCMIM